MLFLFPLDTTPQQKYMQLTRNILLTWQRRLLIVIVTAFATLITACATIGTDDTSRVRVFLDRYDGIISTYEAKLESSIAVTSHDWVEMDQAIFRLGEEFQDMSGMSNWDDSDKSRYEEITERYSKIVGPLSRAK